MIYFVDVSGREHCSESKTIHFIILFSTMMHVFMVLLVTKFAIFIDHIKITNK